MPTFEEWCETEEAGIAHKLGIGEDVTRSLRMAWNASRREFGKQLREIIMGGFHPSNDSFRALFHLAQEADPPEAKE